MMGNVSVETNEQAHAAVAKQPKRLSMNPKQQKHIKGPCNPFSQHP